MYARCLDVGGMDLPWRLERYSVLRLAVFMEVRFGATWPFQVRIPVRVTPRNLNDRWLVCVTAWCASARSADGSDRSRDISPGGVC